LQIRKIELWKNFNEGIDYSHVLNHQLKNERENLLYYNDLEIEIKEKLHKVAVSINSLESNQIEKQKKSRNVSKISMDLNDKINSMNNLIYMQSSKCEDISKSLNLQKSSLMHEREVLKNKNSNMEKTVISKKSEYKTLMKTVDKIKLTKTEKENSVVKTILGLDLIKRLLFVNNRFIIGKEEEGSLELVVPLMESEDYHLFKNVKLGQENMITSKAGFRTSSLNLSSTRHISLCKSDERTRAINMSEIKSKFENLNLEFEELFDFHTKVLNKRQFNRSLMINYNLKVTIH
jgi:hypothetical protein